MSMRGKLSIAVVCAAAILAGCKSSMIDSIETTSLLENSGDISASDLQSGKLHFLQANYGLSEKHYRKAVELRGDNAEAWLGLAASYDQLGRFDFADRAYAQLLKIAGRRPQVVNNMGYSQYLRGNRKKARKLLQEARRGMADPTVVDANLKLLARG